MKNGMLLSFQNSETYFTVILLVNSFQEQPLSLTQYTVLCTAIVGY